MERTKWRTARNSKQKIKYRRQEKMSTGNRRWKKTESRKEKRNCEKQKTDIEERKKKENEKKKEESMTCEMNTEMKNVKQ